MKSVIYKFYLFFIGFMFSFLVPVYAETLIGIGDQRYNIVLVIDASGSMLWTDPDNLRHEAVRLFLDRLGLEGHNVGAVVFDDTIRLNTGINPFNTNEDRYSLYQIVRGVPVRGWTNIGGALLVAVDELIEKQNKNGLMSVVILLTDGITQMPDPRIPRPHLIECPIENELSRQEGQRAIERAINNGIHIFGAFLNHEGRYVSQELFDLVRASRNNENDPVSPPREIGEHGFISSLDNQFAEIHSSEVLDAIAIQFANRLRGITLPAGRVVTDGRGYFILNNIELPIGTYELNVNIRFHNEPFYILLTNPIGEKFHYGISPEDTTNILLNALNENTTRGSRNWNIRKINPIPGTWEALVFARPFTAIYYDIVLSTRINANLVGIYFDNKITYKSWLTFNDINIPMVDGGYATPFLQFWIRADNIHIYYMDYSAENNLFYHSFELPRGALNYARAVYSFGYNYRQRMHSGVVSPLLESDPLIRIEQHDSIIKFFVNAMAQSYNLIISDNKDNLINVLINKNQANDFYNVVLYENIELGVDDNTSEMYFSINVTSIASNFTNIYHEPLFFLIRNVDAKINYIHNFQVSRVALSRRDLSIIFILLGIILIGIAIKYALQKYKHIVRVERDIQQNEYTIFPKRPLYIIGTGGARVDNEHVLSYNNPVFDGKIIAKLVTTSILPLPVFQKNMLIKSESTEIKMNDNFINLDGVNEITVTCGSESQLITIWHKNESMDKVNKENFKNIAIFIVSSLIGLVSIILGVVLGV